MRRILLNCLGHSYSSQTFKLNPKSLPLPPPSIHSTFNLFSSHNPNRSLSPNPRSTVHDDVSNEEFKAMISKYLEEDDENMVPSIFEAILKRKLSRKHNESDDEILDEIDKRKMVGSSEVVDYKRERLDDSEDIEFVSDSEESDEFDYKEKRLDDSKVVDVESSGDESDDFYR